MSRDLYLGAGTRAVKSTMKRGNCVIADVCHQRTPNASPEDFVPTMKGIAVRRPYGTLEASQSTLP